MGGARWRGGYHRRLTARGSIPTRSLSMWSLHVLLCMCGFSPASSHSSKVRLIGDLKFFLGVSVSGDCCLSRLALCGPVIDPKLD